jgi:hypothetical protein
MVGRDPARSRGGWTPKILHFGEQGGGIRLNWHRGVHCDNPPGEWVPMEPIR